MLVMDIWIVRVTVRQRLMGVRMRMRLAATPFEIVRMLVMGIMHVLVRVRDRFMSVRVLMALGQVQPHAGAHQRSREPEHQ